MGPVTEPEFPPPPLRAPLALHPWGAITNTGPVSLHCGSDCVEIIAELLSFVLSFSIPSSTPLTFLISQNVPGKQKG